MGEILEIASFIGTPLGAILAIAAVAELYFFRQVGSQRLSCPFRKSTSFATLADIEVCETAARSAPFVKLPVSTIATKCVI
jgi:hypothetical protein